MPNYTLDQLKNEYLKQWSEMTITRPQSINAAADKVIKGKKIYTTIEAKTGVPWYFIGIVHLRESDCDFSTHLHNGDSLAHRTHNVPAGRPKIGKPPFTFEESAIDALNFEGFGKIKTWSIEQIAYCFEQYNGWGYRMRHTPSAYLWSGSNQYTSGKFVRDHVFDPNVKDVQLGTMCVLKVILEKEQTKPIIATSPIIEDSDDEEENKDYKEAKIERPTASQMNKVSTKHWWNDWLQWLGLGSAFTGTAVQTAGNSGIESFQNGANAIKNLGMTIGIYGLIILALGLAFFFWYQNRKIKNDYVEGRSTPSGGEPI